ncbi:MAG: LysE family transporter [Rhodobacteraceae bacterium]|nr:LysE family transporter [Paracoccaceae bacterium]MCC5966625.1 LysE family transporter [Natronohydrobacter sp.]
MTPDAFLAFCTFAFASSVTPGPTSFLLLTSGLNFGVRRSAPMTAGLVSSFIVMLAATAASLSALMLAYPGFKSVMQILASAYLLWLALRLALASFGDHSLMRTSEPLGFWGGFTFQLVNPKAWVVSLTSMAAFLPERAQLMDIILYFFSFAMIAGGAYWFWLSGGALLASLIRNSRQVRIFNLVMAILLAGSVLTVW